MITEVQGVASRELLLTKRQTPRAETPALPLPALSVSAFGDSMALLAAAFASQEASETAFATTAVAGHKRAREFHLERVKEQQDKQLRASHGPGLFGSLFKLLSDAFRNILKFDVSGLLSDLGHDLDPLVTSKALWSDLQAIGKSIAKIAVAVGAAALAGLSLGAASAPAIILAALILSTSSAIVGESKCLDGLLGKGWSERIAAGLGAASALVTGGASALSITSAATSLGGTVIRDTKVLGEASAWVGLGLSLGSGALQLGASLSAADRIANATSNAPTTGTRLLEEVDVAAAGTSAAGKILEGSAGTQTARVEYDIALSKVHEKAAQIASDEANQQTKWAVDQMKQVTIHLLRSREILADVVAKDAENGRVATRSWS